MTREEHLLTIAMEECNEIAQRLSKALRFGLEEIQPGQGLNNAMRVESEFADLVGVLRMLHMGFASPEAISAKQEKVEKFLAYSLQCGTLTLHPSAPSKVIEVERIPVSDDQSQAITEALHQGKDMT